MQPQATLKDQIDLSLKLLPLALKAARWLGRRLRIDRYLLIRMYRAAGRKVCSEFQIEWKVVKPIFRDPSLINILYRDQYPEKTRNEKLDQLLKKSTLLRRQRLLQFRHRLSQEALDRMEDSLWWQDRAKQQIAILLSRPTTTQPTERSRFFSTSPSVQLMSDSLIVSRKKELTQVLEKLRRFSRSEGIGETVALWGAPGDGKAALAMDIHHKAEREKIFSDGTLWVSLGDDCEDPTITLNKLILHVDSEEQSLHDIGLLVDSLRRKLQDGQFLIVLDDLCSKEHLRYFIQGGPHCAHLITTSDLETIREDVNPDQIVKIHEMEQDEAVDLLKIKIADNPGLSAADDELRKLAERIGRQPLLLRVAGSLLAEYVSLGKESPSAENAALNAIAILNKSLDESGLSTFGNRAEATIESGLKELSLKEKDLCRELAIFPVGKSIPLGAVYRLWASPGNLKQSQVVDLCRKLYNRSLLSEFNLYNGTIRLHRSISQYLIDQQQGELLTKLNNRFLSAYGIAPEWQLLFDNDDQYLSRHLGFHLVAADRSPELLSTVKNWHYLVKKTSACGSRAVVEEDLDTALRIAPKDISLQRLSRAFRDLKHLSHGPGEDIETLLFGRLRHLKDVLQNIPIELPSARRPYLYLNFPFPQGSLSVESLEPETQEDQITSCSYSHDRKLLVTQSKDSIKIWNPESGELAAQQFPESRQSEPRTCTINPSGNVVVSALGSTLKIWSVESKQAVKVFDYHKASVNKCAFSPDGLRMVSASSDQSLLIWETESWEVLKKLSRESDWEWDDLLKRNVETNVRIDGHFTAVNDAAFNEQSNLVVSASDDGSLKIWDVDAGQVLRTLSAHSEPINACAFSHNGKFIVSASTDCTLRIWVVETGKLLEPELRGHKQSVNGCAFSKDDSLIVSASSDGTVRVWDVTSRRCVASFYDKEAMNCCLIDEDMVVAGGNRGLYFLTLVR